MLEIVSYTLPGAIHLGLGLVVVALLSYLLVNRKKNLPPGPTPFPVIGNLKLLMNGDVLKTLRDLRIRYGDVFSLKLGVYNAVVVNGHETMKELLVKKGDVTSNRPDTFAFKDISSGKGLCVRSTAKVIYGREKLKRKEKPGLGGSSGPLWKIHRSFALTTLRNFGFGKRNIEERIMEEVMMFLNELESKEGKAIDLDGIINTSVSNIICSIVFGQRFEYSDERFTRLLKHFNENFKHIGPSALINFFPFLKYLPGDLFKGKLILKNINSMMQFLSEIIKEHVETYDENNIRDYIDAYLKEMKHNKDTFTETQLVRSIADLFVAGTETTSTSIKWAVLFFLHRPDVQVKMRQELDDVVGTSRPPSLNDRNNLPYCEAVIAEVLRLGNVAPLSLQHSCNADVSFRGYTIPKGTIIIPNLDSVHSDTTNFENADKFKPERFIDKNGQFLGEENVVAFSIGRRVCLGESLAKSELFLYLTSMVQRFEFVPKEDNSLPSLTGVVGLSHSPQQYEFCALKRNE